jgi:hypothetical protein
MSAAPLREKAAKAAFDTWEGRGQPGRPALSGPLNDAHTSPCGPFLAVHPGWPPSRLAGFLKHTLSSQNYFPK